ncbi:MAG: PglZ domain-containing protein [Paludibacter sp.]|nr:PglZ domain-containing protein [Paludibacter sp.]
MTDKWFLQDIEHQLQLRNRVVVIDPKGQCEFLLPLLDGAGYQLIKTDSNLTDHWQTVQEELLLRHEAETQYKDKPVIFYVTREQEKLSFLFDYCFTHGCLNLSNPTEWLKNKLFTNTGLQVNMDSPMLLTAAKLGVGKDLAWWKKILQNLEELISVDDELLPFLHEPDNYFKNKDKEVSRLFEEKLFELIGQPYTAKPPKTLATEVVKLLFDSLLANSVSEQLIKLYFKWVDSDTYSNSLQDYISQYKINSSTNVWGVNPNHCFPQIDRKALQEITANLRDKSYVSEKLVKIKERAKAQKVKKLIPAWWQDIITLLEFDSKPLTACNSFSKVANFYVNSFSKVDRAIRNLYANFLQDETIIRPLQEYYENLNRELLQQWFEYASAYKSDQQGYLVDLFKTAKPGIAVIVGDGVRYEIADFVASTLEKQFKVERNTMLADIPSETEHNMSALYVGNNEVLAIHKDREKKLSELSGKEITYMNLEALHYGFKADFLVLTYKDIDSTGEKLQHGAIKLFSEFEKTIADSITLLLKMGYREVHLVTDHGFVLTGLLDEADKISPSVSGKNKVSERYIRTVDKQTNPDWICFDKKYEEFNYVVVAKNHRPFKSKGVYGFSHGGFTPQEIIIPKFVFSKVKEAAKGLEVRIEDKKNLAEVIGNIFAIKLYAVKAKNDLFSSTRKVQILLFANGKQYSKSNISNMQAGSTTIVEFDFNGNDTVLASLIDVETLEQLDSVKINKSNARDFGGLF